MALLRNLAIGAVALVGAGVGGSYVVPQAKADKLVEINRPVATVYALLASTPEQVPVAEGMSQTVTALDLRKRVLASLSFANKAGKLEYILTPSATGTSVQIKLTQDPGFNPVERYQGMNGTQLAPVVEAVAAWAIAEANKTPTADFSDLVYEVTTVPAKTWLYLEGSTTRKEGQIIEGARQANNILKTVFANNNLQLNNPLAVETDWNEATDTYAFNFGIPYVGQRPSVLIGVKAGETPSGTAIKVVYTGAEATILPDVYNKIDALIAATRLTEGTNFEEYLDDPTQPGGSRNRLVYYIVTGNTEALKNIAPSATAPAPAPAAAPASVTPAPAPDAATAPATPAPAPTPTK